MIVVDYSNERQRGVLRATTSGDEERLRSAVVLSLLTWRRDESDGEPRHGWWGELDDGPFGSRLWKLWRSKKTETTLREAEGFAREALTWLERERIVRRVAVTAAWEEHVLVVRVDVTLTDRGRTRMEVPVVF